MSLADYQSRFERLVVNVRGGRASPHKICMLLAVLDLARAGALPENRILFAPPLLERYSMFFAAVKGPNDHNNPYFPFFHLKGRLRGGADSFWSLEPLPGKEAVLAAMGTVSSSSDITNTIACARLDGALFDLLQDLSSVDALSRTLSERWFNRGLQDLQAVVKRCSEVSNYERRLRGEWPLVARAPAPPEFVRGSAFRRVVIELYDYRCAATGLRLLLDSGEAMVEAAHIHPFSEAGDDDPRNGLALTPNMHWAMDRNLIAPGPDFRWHVSPLIDTRIPDFAPLLAIQGKEILRPQDRRMWPKLDVLTWRLDRLRERGWATKTERRSET